ncbi:MAG: sugar ABC transporter ATP-binding protein, partial [Acidimicrobiales bacterium]
MVVFARRGRVAPPLGGGRSDAVAALPVGAAAGAGSGVGTEAGTEAGPEAAERSETSRRGEDGAAAAVGALDGEP